MMKNTLLILGSLFLCLQLSFAQESCSDLMNKGYEQAAKENKNVFVIFHASWCGWCKKMEKNINDEKCKDFFNSNYIFVYLTVKETDVNKHLENPGALKLLKKYKGENEGIPFWLIFDKEGSLIGDSFNKEGKNMGCPASTEEVEQFAEILEKTSELTEDELEIVKGVFLIKAGN